MGLGLRLAAATACLLVPGFLIAAALRVPGFSAAFAWSFGALFVATALMFLVHSSLTWALILLAAITVGAGVAAALRRDRPRQGVCPRSFRSGWPPPASASGSRSGS